MKIIISKNVSLELTKEQSQALQDELRYACHTVSVFPTMERLLNLMEA